MLFGCNRPLARPWECSGQSGGQNSHIFWHENLNSQKRKFRLSCPPDWLHSHDVQGVYSRCIADVFRMGLGADSNRWEGGVGDLRCASTDRCICLHISDAKQRSPNRNKRKQLFIVFIHMTDTEASMGMSYDWHRSKHGHVKWLTQKQAWACHMKCAGDLWALDKRRLVWRTDWQDGDLWMKWSVTSNENRHKEPGLFVNVKRLVELRNPVFLFALKWYESPRLRTGGGHGAFLVGVVEADHKYSGRLSPLSWMTNSRRAM